jgi:hypothetical protein
MTTAYIPAVHYHVDLHEAVIASAKILDVVSTTSGLSELNGSFVVRVPGDVAIQSPATLADLLSQKYAGLLAAYAGFTEILWDDLLDPLHVDTVYPLFAGRVGDRSSIVLNPAATFQSTVFSPIPGAAPSQAVVLWEVYNCVDLDPRAGRLVRQYGGRFSDDVSTCEVSFDNGVSFYAVTDGGVVNIPPASQGTDFIIRITNTDPASRPLYLGSWAVIY